MSVTKQKVRVTEVTESPEKDIIFHLSKDEILACAYELGIAQERVTDRVMELLKKKVDLEFSNWPQVVKRALKEIIGCPLGLACYPSCFWWKDSECTFPEKVAQESKVEKGGNRCLEVFPQQAVSPRVLEEKKGETG